MKNIRNEDLLGSNKVIVGNKYSDLILETLGKVYIKTGNSSKVLDDILKSVDTLDESSALNKTIIVLNTTELQKMKYPGDGFLIFNALNASLYISYKGEYLLLVSSPDDGYVKRSGDTMTGQLEILTNEAPLIVSSSEVIRNFNSEYINGYSSSDLAKRAENENISGKWIFENNNIAESDWLYKSNINVRKDINISGEIGSPLFASGFGGYGWRLKDNTLTIDNLIVRKTMRVYELIVNQISATNGNIWVSNSSKCTNAVKPYMLSIFDINTISKQELLELLLPNSYYLIYDSDNATTTEEFTTLLSDPNGNFTPAKFTDYEYLIYIKDPNTIINSELFTDATSLYDKSILDVSWEEFNKTHSVTYDTFMEYRTNLRLDYISKSKKVTTWDETNPIVWQRVENFNKKTSFFIVPKNREEFYRKDGKLSNGVPNIYEIYPYYKYFGNSDIWVVEFKNDKYAVFKPGDIVRCLKFQNNSIKYYDALIMNQIDSYTYIVKKSVGLFDKYTEIIYNNNKEIVNMEVKNNNKLYYQTEKSYNSDTNLMDSIYKNSTINDRLGDITKGDDIVQMGNIYNIERLHAIYITSCDDDSPYIDVLSGINRPDFSVIYATPNYDTIKVYINKLVHIKLGIRTFFYLKNNPGSINPNMVEMPLMFVKNDNELLVNEEITNEILANPTLFGVFITEVPTKDSELVKYGTEFGVKYTTLVKVRLGNLEGIRNDCFKNKQPHGYGLYGENVYLTGEFYLNNGKSVVEFAEDLIKMEVSGITSNNYALNSEGPHDLNIINSKESLNRQGLILEFILPMLKDTEAIVNWELSKELLNYSLLKAQDLIKVYLVQLSPTNIRYDENGYIHLKNITFENLIKLEILKNVPIKLTNDYTAIIFKNDTLYFTISKVMVQKGNKSSRWEPAQLDKVTSSFIMNEDGISLLGKEINMTGKVKFNFLEKDFTDKLNFFNLKVANMPLSTTINGGLISTGLLAAGSEVTVDVVDPVTGLISKEKQFKVKSGISGLVSDDANSTDISYWAGGPPVDRTKFPAIDENGNYLLEAAKALIRMDGSGYFANGAFNWDTAGKIQVNPNSFFFGSASTEGIERLLQLFNPIIGTKEDGSEGIVGIQAYYPLKVRGDVTAYAGEPLNINDSIFKGLPLDPKTLGWIHSDTEGDLISVIGGGGGGGGDSSFDSSKMWGLLSVGTTELINVSHIKTALTNYVSKTGENATGTWNINVSGSAQKLKNVRKIWGNDFDGTKDIEGVLNKVSGINFENIPDNFIQSPLQLNLQVNNKGIIINNTELKPITSLNLGNSTSYWNITYTNKVLVKNGISSNWETNNIYLDSEGYNRLWEGITFRDVNNSNSLHIASKEGITLKSNNNIIFDSGNIGIGTITPTEKLELVGNIKIVGNITATGEITAYSNGTDSGGGDGGGGNIDLSDYYTIEQVDTLLGNKSNKDHTHSQYLIQSSLNGYATQLWVNLQNYLKTYTNNYLSNVRGNGNGVIYFEREGLQTLTLNLQHAHIPDDVIGLNSKLKNYDTHINDNIKHITSTERTNWNTVYNDWTKAFYIDENNNLRLNLNLLGSKEIVAFSSGSNPDSGGGENIDLSNYYTIELVDTLLKNKSNISHIHPQYLTSENLNGYATKSWVDSQNYLKTYINNYLSGVRGSGNSYVYFDRLGLTPLTLNLQHTHSLYLTEHQSLNHLASKDGTNASGTWAIDITGKAKNSANSDRLESFDSRNINDVPKEKVKGLKIDFKKNTINGLNDGGEYNTVITLRGYGLDNDFTGGYPHQLAFSANGNMWLRIAKDATNWNSWNKVWTGLNFNPDDKVSLRGRYSIYTDDKKPYNYIHLFRIANTSSWSTLRTDFEIKFRYYSAKLYLDLFCNEHAFGNGVTYYKVTLICTNNRKAEIYIKTTKQTSDYNYYDVYIKSNSWDKGYYDLVNVGGNGTIVFQHKGTRLEALPADCSRVLERFDVDGELTAKNTTINGNLKVFGNIVATGEVTAYKASESTQETAKLNTNADAKLAFIKEELSKVTPNSQIEDIRDILINIANNI